MAVRMTISLDDIREYTLDEENELKSIMQSVAVILATPLGSCPLYRDFGVDQSYVDRPLPEAKIRMIAPIREAIEKWEPRVQVKDISFKDDPGRPFVLLPVVEVEYIGS